MNSKKLLVEGGRSDGNLSVTLIRPWSNELLALVKQVPGRLFDPEKKLWLCPERELDFMRRHFADNGVQAKYEGVEDIQVGSFKF